MEAATSMKGELCAACTRDLLKVIVEGGKNGTGRFKLIHKVHRSPQKATVKHVVTYEVHAPSLLCFWDFEDWILKSKPV